jgi:hypothetical protein
LGDAQLHERAEEGTISFCFEDDSGQLEKSSAAVELLS